MHHHTYNQPTGRGGHSRHVASRRGWNQPPAPVAPVHWVSHNPRGHTNMQQAPQHSPRPVIPVIPRLPLQPNAFLEWRRQYPHHPAQYTMIDGGKSNQDSEVRVVAKALRTSTRDEILKIVENFTFSHESYQKACVKLVRKTPIFPGLVAYTYTHLAMCRYRERGNHAERTYQLSQLERLIERWGKREVASCIVECDVLKGALLEILNTTKVVNEGHKCNSALLDGEMVLEKDILNLASLVVSCITKGQTRKALWTKGGEGSKTEKLVELLHNLLEAKVELVEAYRRCFLNFLIPFSKEFRCCPPSFYIPENAIRNLQQKAGGGFGEVFCGKLGSGLVAVKKLRQGDTKLIYREAIIWRYLKHPSCLPLYGIYVMKTDTGLVSPWMEGGTLDDYLKHTPTASRTRLILDVLKGLEYLHMMNPHVAHRDIKPSNILVTSTGHARLADFGLASVFDTFDDQHTRASNAHMIGTYLYMAPEMFWAKTDRQKCGVNKRACDMYSLGCTIYEIYMRKPPFERTAKPEEVAAMVISGYRPVFPAGKITLEMWSFVESLWAQDPSERLTVQVALDWMVVQASREGIDSRPPLPVDEWKSTNKFWSVSF